MPELSKLLNEKNKLRKQLVDQSHDEKKVKVLQAKLEKLERRIAALR
jgi:hypothetical protein